MAVFFCSYELCVMAEKAQTWAFTGFCGGLFVCGSDGVGTDFKQGCNEGGDSDGKMSEE